MVEYGGYKIQHDGTFGMYTIKPQSKGSVPKELKGRFTSYGAAKLIIDASLKSQRGKPNAETDPSR
jgi:hypothetical protein